MPRKKKDGRFINYYIDRRIFERLERYANDHGQQMTTAIERILQEHLDKYELELNPKGDGHMMYCTSCNTLVSGSRCFICGSGKLRLPQGEDYCYLTEKETIWTGALGDILTENGIPFVTRNVLGAGLAANIGPSLERTRFYVPYSHYENAQALERGFFSAENIDESSAWEIRK